MFQAGFGEVEYAKEVFYGHEEQLPAHLVGSGGPHTVAADLELLGYLPGEEDCAENHAHDHAYGQVVGDDHGRHGHDEHDAVALRLPADAGNGVPVERLDGHHHHYGRQRAHRNLPHPGRQHQDKEHEVQAGSQG